jgi:hypothetical protein
MNPRGWSMATDRELMALAKSKTLKAIADQMQRSPDLILKKATQLGISIKGRKSVRV